MCARDVGTSPKSSCYIPSIQNMDSWQSSAMIWVNKGKMEVETGRCSDRHFNYHITSMSGKYPGTSPTWSAIALERGMGGLETSNSGFSWNVN